MVFNDLLYIFIIQLYKNLFIIQESLSFLSLQVKLIKQLGFNAMKVKCMQRRINSRFRSGLKHLQYL